jgi:AcrR family transcriptional regulator
MVETTTEARAPRKAGRRERRRAETREKIYRAAMQLFAKRGFFQTTTEDITEAADVGQGTFFNYFPTKQHVLLVLSEKQLAKVAAAIEEAKGGDGPVRNTLHRLMHAAAEEPGRTQALARSLITALISSDMAREFTSARMAQGRNMISELFVIGQDRGEIRKDREPADLAMALQRSFWGTMLMWAMQPKADLHAWLDKTFEDFWAAAEARNNTGCSDKTSRTPGRKSEK